MIALSTNARSEWMEIFDSFEDDEKDIHWLPEYIEAHSLGRDGFLAVTPISISTFVDGVGSPYGYGCAKGGGVFVPIGLRYRFHPLIGHHVGQVEKHVVAIDLDAKDLRAGLSKGHKAAAKKAEKAGINMIAPSVTNAGMIGQFADIYAATMERQRASGGWRLGLDHFARIYELMGQKRAQFFFAGTGWDDQIESACLILHGFNIAYYHFAGSYGNHPKSGINHLMVLRVAEWAKAQGYRWLHLGGGVTADPDDSLLTFKKGFGGRLLPVHVYEGNADGRTH